MVAHNQNFCRGFLRCGIYRFEGIVKPFVGGDSAIVGNISRYDQNIHIVFFVILQYIFKGLIGLVGAIIRQVNIAHHTHRQRQIAAGLCLISGSENRAIRRCQKRHSNET